MEQVLEDALNTYVAPAATTFFYLTIVKYILLIVGIIAVVFWIKTLFKK